MKANQGLLYLLFVAEWRIKNGIMSEVQTAKGTWLLA
jgi:hypothetical protein